MAMTIGIIGADDRAVAIGRMLRRCGHEISFSDPTGHQAAQHAVEALNGEAKACTPYDQASSSDAIVLALHWDDLDRALTALGAYKDGLVIDATRPPALEGGTSGAEMLAKKLDNRHVVKAFVDITDPHEPIRVASDDPEARMQVEEMIRSCGAIVEDAGPLANAAGIERDFTEKHVIK